MRAFLANLLERVTPEDVELQPGLILALLGAYCAYFGVGLCMGYPLGSWNYWKERGLESRLWFHAMLPIGAILGTIVGIFSNKYLGRNKSIAVGAVTSIAAFVALGMKRDMYGHWQPFVGVLLMGIACGLVSHTAPSYLHECSHPKARGGFVSGQYATMAIGLSISILVGLYGTFNIFWIAVCLLPFVIGAVLLANSPASPLWLAECGYSNEERIQQNLHKLHGRSAFADEQMVYLRKPKAKLLSHDVKSMCKPPVYKPLGAVIIMMFIQQVTGIGGLLANFDIVSAGGRAKATALAFVGSHVIASLVAPLLIDRFGRTKMLKVSGSIQTLGLTTLGTVMTGPGTVVDAQQSSLVILGFCLFVVGYSIGNGPIPWVMANELLPGQAKVLTTAASTSSNWAFDCIMAPIFSGLFTNLGPKVTFYSFAAIAVFGIVFIQHFVPETANLPMEDLEKFVGKFYEELFNPEKKTKDPNALVIDNIPGPEESSANLRISDR